MVKTRVDRDSGWQRPSKHRVVAMLLLAVAVMVGSSWNGTAWSEETKSRVGVLSFFPPGNPVWDWWFGFVSRKLAKEGWIEGENVSFEYRSAHADPSRLDDAAAELVALDVDVILASSAPALRAANSATQTIPIIGSDYTSNPVVEGYIASYSHPGGNVTGLFLDAPEFAVKWFEFIKAMVPDLSRVAVLWDPAPGATHVQAIRGVAEAMDIELQVIEVYKPTDIDEAFLKLNGQTQAVVVLPSPMTYGQSQRLSRLALEYGLPTSSMSHDFAKVGGTLSYGPDATYAGERVAVLLAKVLSGTKPADIPIERPTKTLLIVNLKTARVLGITIPDSILLRADEVIE